MLSIGALIWVSLRPLLRLVLCTGFGFLITRADIFPVVAARGVGQVALNITGPCLMFSKIVPAFSTGNIGTLGPLFLVAFLYEGLGLALAWIVKQFFWVPHRFRYGILVAGGWGNYGDIPTSVVMSITAGPPFNSTGDQTLAVAYISAFVLVFYITLFPMGGSRLLAMDWAGPDIEDDEVREAIRLRRQSIWQFWTYLARAVRRFRPARSAAIAESDDEKGRAFQEDKHSPAHGELAGPTDGATSRRSGALEIVTAEEMLPAFCSAAPTEIMSPITSPAPTVVQVDATMQIEEQKFAGSSSRSGRAVEQGQGTGTSRPNRRSRAKNIVKEFLVQFSSPPSISIVVSFIISLINPLKGLFVAVPGSHIPNAPDGQPPLAFVMDTATFVGAASVPLGLICLGSALARLKVPVSVGAWKAMPVGAISAFAVAKIVVSPVIGVLVCEGLTHAGIIDRTDKVLRFVCMFFSCLPTATTQVYLTQVYSPTGSAEHVSAFLVPQYALMIIFMTILTAYSLNLIF